MLRSLLYKVILLRKKNFIRLILQILIVWGVFVIFFFTTPEGIKNVPTRVYSPENVDNCFNYLSIKYVVIYTPDTNFVNNFMRRLKDKLWKSLPDENLISAKDEKSIEISVAEYVRNDIPYNILVYAVIFNLSDTKHFRYTIRLGGFKGDFQTSLLEDGFLKNTKGEEASEKDEIYNKYCFLTLQKMIDVLYIEMITGKPLNYSISICKMPTQNYHFSGERKDIIIVMDVSFLFLIYFTIADVTSKVIKEISSGMMEFMKIMGIRSSMIWIHWIFYFNIAGIPISIGVTLLLTVRFKSNAPALLPNVNFFILWIFLLLSMNIALIFLFVICALNIRNSALLSNVLCFNFYFMAVAFVDLMDNFYLYRYLDEDIKVRYLIFLRFLIPQYCYIMGFYYLSEMSKMGSHISWSIIFQEVTLKTGHAAYTFSFASVLLMLLVDAVLYSFLIWYIEEVKPGKYGGRRPWHFFFTFCFRRMNKKANTDCSLSSHLDRKYFESPPDDVKIGLSIQNVSKSYGSVAAVKHVCLDIYKGQIFVLLGQNGNGKTTLMRVITGMYPPDNGKIYYYTDDKYFDIHKNLYEFRKKLGYCPQDIQLFPYLTVMENLKFFSLIRSTETRNNLDDYILDLLALLEMQQTSDSQVGDLSGGMKRKLQIAICLINQPKVLVLDEPSAGLDPHSRRVLWDIILNIRPHHTIILITQLMEEADVLGDCIAIIRKGEILCCGSNHFIKDVYESGYVLELTLSCRSEILKIIDAIIEITPEAKPRNYHKHILTFTLPFQGVESFPKLFHYLESHSSDLYITNIGVSCQSIEDVFLKSGDLMREERMKASVLNMSEIDVESERGSGSSTDSYIEELNLKISTSGRVLESTKSFEHVIKDRLKKFPLVTQHFYILSMKKLFFIYYRKWTYLIFVFISLVSMYFTFQAPTHSLSAVLRGDNKNKPLLLSEHLFKSSKVFSVYSSDGVGKIYATKYKSIIKKSSVEMERDKSLTPSFLDLDKRDPVMYRRKYIISASWSKDEVIVYYSALFMHSAPVSLNLVMNALLKSLSRKDVSILTSNHPFHLESWGACKLIKEDVLHNLAHRLAATAVLVMLASFLVFPALERRSGMKHLQLMTCLSPITYWAVMYFLDLLIMNIFFLAVIPFMYLGGNEIKSLWKITDFGIFLIIMIFAGNSGIVFVLALSFLKKGLSSSAPVLFILYNFTLAMLHAYIASSYFQQTNIFGPVGTIHFQNVCTVIMEFNPCVCLFMATYQYFKVVFKRKACSICDDVWIKYSENCRDYQEIRFFDLVQDFRKNSLGRCFVIFIISWIVHLLLVLILDLRANINFSFKRHKRCESREIYFRTGPQEARIILSREIVNPSCGLIVNRLNKKRRTDFIVKNITFNVKCGTCFGLLGHNASGKTTIFKILTGKIKPTSGEAYLNRYSLSKDRSKFLEQIGYCPQENTFLEGTTGEQMIILFGSLRGLRTKDSIEEANHWIDTLGLKELSKIPFNINSEGNMRKFCIAMAMVGEPAMIFLDEPTTSVDVLTRQNIWEIILKCLREGQSFVLATHSMEESEQLCDRLTILLKGQMDCIGTIEDLKQNYGRGYTINIKLERSRVTETKLVLLKEAIINVFSPECFLKEESMDRLEFQITNKTIAWSYLFEKMEEIYKKHNMIAEYTVCDISLEQVFLSFNKTT